MNYTSLSRTKCYDYIQRLEDGEDILAATSKRGRKKKLSAQKISGLTKYVNNNPEKVSTRKLAGKYGVSKTTMHGTLVDEGFEFKTVKTRQEMEEIEDWKRKRMKFCEELYENDRNKLHNILFIDETGIKIQDAYPSKVWSKRGQHIEEITSEKIKLHIWGGISAAGTFSLEIFEDNFNQDKYIDILKDRIDEFRELCGSDVIILQDQHNSHFTDKIRKWADEQDVRFIKLPSRSSDLNPIENIWD